MAGVFTEIPYDTKAHLISYHTEGQGENTVGTAFPHQHEAFDAPPPSVLFSTP